MAGGVAQAFFDRVLAQARQRDLLSDEHFTVDATLLEAWASLKSFRPKDNPGGAPPDDPGNPTVDFHGERRSNETHQSTTDREARLYRKGKGREAKLYYMGHAVMENRNGLVVQAEATLATDTAETETEEIFGWLKTVGVMRKLRHRGTDRVDWMFVFTCAAYNLVRLRNLAAAA